MKRFTMKTLTFKRKLLEFPKIEKRFHPYVQWSIAVGLEHNNKYKTKLAVICYYFLFFELKCSKACLVTSSHTRVWFCSQQSKVECCKKIILQREKKDLKKKS